MSAKKPVGVVAADASFANRLKGPIKSAGLGLLFFASVKALIDQDDEDTPVGCVVAELCAGPNVMRELEQALFIVPVVLFAGNAPLAVAVQAMKAGAFDVVENTEALVESVWRALALSGKYQQLLDDRAAASQKIRSLTQREREVFVRMVRGLPNRRIAEELEISPKTLDIHRANLLFKMEVKTIAELCRMHLMDRVNPMLLPQIFG
ncbi:MAG: hypothetical protein HYX68_22195 [Planctomycetes bacterium]|jgi:two-component system response regulator FixJ|nr:hypothetical protein [Planctomycetota bacterium]